MIAGLPTRRGAVAALLALLVIVLLALGLAVPAAPEVAAQDGGGGYSWDIPGWLNVYPLPAQDCSTGCWRLASAHFLDEAESQGLHHVFVKLLDEQGRQLADEPWTVAWEDNSYNVLLSKPAPDWADDPLWSCYFPDQGHPGPYRAFAGEIERHSDVVHGMGLPYCWHVSFQLTWRWEAPRTPTPRPTATRTATPSPSPTPCAGCVDRLWLPVVGR